MFNLGIGLSSRDHSIMLPRYLLTFSVTLLITGAPQSVGIERVAWLQGCWQANSPRRVIEEAWTAPRGRSMLGVSRTFRGDTLVEYEFVVLREQAAGLTYEAHPSRQAPATFAARAASDSVVIFENTAHDFPQRIGYRKAGDDSLVAWIEGTIEGRPQRIDFPYARVACPGR